MDLTHQYGRIACPVLVSGTISLDLTALAGSTVGVTWYNPLTGQYHDQGTTPGGVVRSFASPFGASQSALVLMAH